MVQISRPTPVTATYRLVVDGIEKSRFSSITRSSANYYCQRDRSKYQETTIECIWNDITIYKEEAIKRLYKGYLNEKIFITTESITKSEALKNCLLNSNNNPQSSIRCVWNDSEIYSRKAPNPPIINKPYISLEDHSLSLGTFTAYA